MGDICILRGPRFQINLPTTHIFILGLPPNLNPHLRNPSSDKKAKHCAGLPFRNLHGIAEGCADVSLFLQVFALIRRCAMHILTTEQDIIQIRRNKQMQAFQSACMHLCLQVASRANGAAAVIFLMYLMAWLIIFRTFP